MVIAAALLQPLVWEGEKCFLGESLTSKMPWPFQLDAKEQSSWGSPQLKISWNNEC